VHSGQAEHAGRTATDLKHRQTDLGKQPQIYVLLRVPCTRLLRPTAQPSGPDPG